MQWRITQFQLCKVFFGALKLDGMWCNNNQCIFVFKINHAKLTVLSKQSLWSFCFISHAKSSNFIQALNRDFTWLTFITNVLFSLRRERNKNLWFDRPSQHVLTCFVCSNALHGQTKKYLFSRLHMRCVCVWMICIQESFILSQKAHGSQNGIKSHTIFMWLNHFWHLKLDETWFFLLVFAFFYYIKSLPFHNQIPITLEQKCRHRDIRLICKASCLLCGKQAKNRS